MTANVMPDEREKCISFGMNDYISKPFKEVDLFTIVNSYIGSEKEVKMGEASVELKNENQSFVVDFEHLQTLSRGNQTFKREIVDIFLKQNPIEIKELELAISHKNYQAIRAISHKMKTSVGFIGINQLLPILTNIENFAILEGDINSIQNMFNTVNAICNQANIELESII